MKIDNGVKIASIEGAEVLKIKAGLEGEIKYNCVFSNSLLLDKLKKIGLKISKQGSTKDIINVKYSYSYTAEEVKEMICDIKDTKAKIKTIKKDNKDATNRIKQLNKLIDNNSEELKQYKEDIKLLTDENEVSKLQKKIDTRESKIIKYKNELNGIDISYENDIKDNCNLIKELEDKINNDTYKKDMIRNKLYNEGFSLQTYITVNGKKEKDKVIDYVYFFRTGGKAKDGTVYFINEKLYKEIEKWQRMGIKLPNEDCKLVEMEVYKSLISSALVKDNCYLTIKPEEILVVKDLKCYSELQDVIEIKKDENDKNGKSIAVHKKAKCENVICDGMCMLQKDDSIGLSEGFRGLRHHFYKTAGFIADYQLYFQEFYGDDYENAYITDMFDRPVKVSTCKMITTNNALKFIKFLGATKEAFEQWAEYVRENDCKFGICKENHVSKFGYNEDGNILQRMSYQMLQTLDITRDQLQEIFNDSLDYIMKLKNNDKFFIEHLKRTANTTNNNELLADLATLYPKFISSYMFKNARKQEVYQYKETLKRGKLLSESENETILANPMTLLKYCTGQIDDYIHDGVITVNSKGDKLVDEMLPDTYSAYCLKFKHGQTLGSFRSPHNSQNNILEFQNCIKEEYNKYFKYFGDNVIAVNMLYNDVQAKGNGLDEDLDFLYTTTNPTILEAVRKAQKFPTIINGFELAEGDKAIKYNNTMEDRSKVDNILQLSQKAIGTSSNVAMLYLTQYWHLLHEQENKINNEEIDDYNYYFIDKPNEDNKLEKMLDNVCILSVLAQVAVDASKRRMIVGNGDDGLNKEIERLRKELPFKEKPTFWQYTSSSFDNDEIEKKLKNKDKESWKEASKTERSLAVKQEKQNMIEDLYDYNCPFNWLLKEVDKIEDANYTGKISDENFLVMYGDGDSRDGKQAKKIEGIVEEFNKSCRYLNTYEDEDEETVNLYYAFIYNEYLEKVKRYSVDLDTMSLMIARALNKENKFLKSNSKIKTKLLNILYKKDRDNFVKCFRDYEK